jgi:transposase-like protein
MTIALPVRHRRNHSIEFKTDLVTMCRQPGVSLSAVALENGVNANLLRRWMKQFPVDAKLPIVQTPAKLVPVQVEPVNTSPTNEDIQFDIRRGSTRINIRWPMDKAEACAQWLSGWLK